MATVRADEQRDGQARHKRGSNSQTNEQADQSSKEIIFNSKQTKEGNITNKTKGIIGG